ncbi:MAG: DUF2384 domain-containing protein [Betaproteobacteria bacterium]|nr:MAG: DUF2384 domain-containing protein [Betaproteobacteria bacterium]
MSTVAVESALFYRRLTQLLAAHKPLRGDRDVAAFVRAGVRPEAIEHLARAGLGRRDLASVVPPRTLTHRHRRRERLSRDESDRAVRLARLVALAETVFGDRSAALAWLSTPKRRFDGATPLEAAASEAGARLVEDWLWQADEGYFA